jgi:glutamate racemase
MHVHIQPPHLNPNAQIGVFDSGIGGLSIVRALRQLLPHERFVYYADSLHAPYGEKGDAFVCQRSLAIAGQLQNTVGIKALVVACNTATAAAIVDLRHAYPELPIIGIEPALKPALAHSRSGAIAVMATRGTLLSHKFQTLLAAVQAQSPAVRVICQPCDGLADAIERHCHDLNHAAIHRLVQQHVAAVGMQQNSVDTLILGCTHYPLILPVWRAHLPDNTHIIDNGAAVARQLQVRLKQADLLMQGANHASDVQCLTSSPVFTADALAALAQAMTAPSPC